MDTLIIYLFAFSVNCNNCPIANTIGIGSLTMWKGEAGEKMTRDELSANLDPDVYSLHHDIIVPFKNGSSQIDHIVVSRFGIFIIETKNLSG